MSGRASRRKGHDFEREFCRWVRDEFGISFGRNLKQYSEAQNGDTDPLGPFLPECKSYAKPNPKAWWPQAVVQAERAGLVPLLVVKIPRAKHSWIAYMPLDFLLKDEGDGWRKDWKYTVPVFPEGLAYIVRERLQG